MCGIAGYSCLGSDQRVEPEPIARMIAALHHRGPDDHGMVVFPQVALANARLSIQDIAGGHQPMYNQRGTTVVVYNGEIYNTPELRRELEALGHHFKTHCDTEVILHLYDRYGLDCLARLNGMFALALYDRERERLLLARDRFGVKPLVYSWNGTKLCFASELKALRCLPDFDATLSAEGLSTFMGLFYIPDPFTIYSSVKKLRPGHFLVLDRNGLQEREYFDLSFGRNGDLRGHGIVEETGRLLRQAIERQLLADVPVGVLLSGGLDSRSMLAGATEFGQGRKAFTITFDEAAFDEGHEASFWAKTYGSEHEKLVFSEHDFCRQLLARQRHLDEPYALWCNVASAALAVKIRDSGYKVVLSGEGGDELFFGYPTIHAAYLARFYRRWPGALQALTRFFVEHLPAGGGRLPLSFKMKSFFRAIDDSPLRTFFGFKEVLRYTTWPQLLTPEALAKVGHIDPALAFTQYRDKVEDLPLADGMAYLDFKVFLPGCSFVGNDNAYMSASVETRVPMMDNDLVDFVTALPLAQRFHPYRLKPLLRQALLETFKVPAAAARRARSYQKNGFEVPGNEWLQRDPFRALLRSCLSPKRIEAAGFFRPDAVAHILSEQDAGRQNNERLLQAILSLNLFLEGTYSA